MTGLVLPEDHNGHHINPEIEFGDIFRFYDAPLATRSRGFARSRLGAVALWPCA